MIYCGSGYKVRNGSKARTGSTPYVAHNFTTNQIIVQNHAFLPVMWIRGMLVRIYGSRDTGKMSKSHITVTKVFSYYSCLMMEGSGSVLLTTKTYGSEATKLLFSVRSNIFPRRLAFITDLKLFWH
jgi:hypothetical protein